MKKIFSILLILGLSTSSFSQKMTNNLDSLSYSIGILMAKNLKGQGLETINIEFLTAAWKDVYEAKALKIDEKSAGNMFQMVMQEKTQKRNEAVIAVGKEFLEKNSQRKEVVVLPSGLQYEILTKGSGGKPAATNKVTVHYEGTLIDGTVFDSSYERGSPATFGVTQVIKGWIEGLQLMPQGSKWKFYIPYNLAYGERGSPPNIGPYSALIFTVELISIQ